MYRVLVIGKKSFIGSNLYSFLRKKVSVDLLSFLKIKKKNKNFFKKYNCIINCSVNPNYVKNKYTNRFDNDLLIANKIKNLQVRYIFFSSRKVYRPNYNIKETSFLQPKCNYSKNKLNTEKNLFRILKQRLLILRVSNIIGLPIKNNNRKVHWTFIDQFFDLAKKGIIYDNGHNFKDFISIDKFSEIVFFCIKKKVSGVYNISIGEKVNLNKIIKWLNYFNKKKCKIVKIKNNLRNKDNFTLNNKKLMKIISFKYSINDLEKYCKKISKIYFKK